MVFVYTKNESGEFVCKDCKFTTMNQSTMHYHFRNHDGTLTHECPECDKKFLQKSVLDLHILSKHSEEKPKKEFSCPCCTYSDLRKGNLAIHFARIHLKDITDKMKTKSAVPDTVTQCESCSKSFKSMTLFYYHCAACVRLPEKHAHAETWKKLKA